MLRFAYFRIFAHLLLLVGIMLMVGCSNEPRFYYIPPVNHAERYAKAVQNLIDQLSKKDIIIAQVGETMRLVLPSDRVFTDDSSNLNPDFLPTLKQVGQLLAMLESTSVQVNGYTDNLGSKERDLALSQRQAEVVAAYLWKQKADARLLTSHGYGASSPIASNVTQAGRALNRRIEIRFQYVPFLSRVDLQ